MTVLVIDLLQHIFLHARSWFATSDTKVFGLCTSANALHDFNLLNHYVTNAPLTNTHALAGIIVVPLPNDLLIPSHKIITYKSYYSLELI